MDLELLFSKAPFVRSDLQRMAMVEPRRTENLKIDSANGVNQLKLDEDQQRQTLLIEAVSGASRSTALYYGGDLTTYVSEGFGQLQTTDSESHRPISSIYVKVYAYTLMGRSNCTKMVMRMLEVVRLCQCERT
ncbi:hypothetical protein N9250_02420 [bacterium]|nr:hypothetical protein [bacterium]